ncbi:MAG: NUDIX hydrolase [Aridibacter famidurans]|nr:NUDIX hydrolase [Aridibacter famidurans]
MPPKIISTEKIASCDLFDVTRSKIAENGVEYSRDIVVHPGSAVIVPYFEDGTIALVSQYRHAAGKELLELPAGSLEDGETALVCAAREIREEVGFSAEKLEKLTEFFVSPGFLTETMAVFLATGLTHDPLEGDADEFIDIRRFPLADAAEMARRNAFSDAKTMLGILFAEMRLREGV